MSKSVMYLRHEVIVNPAAGKRNPAAFIKRLFDDFFLPLHMEYGLHLTRHPRHARELVSGMCGGGDEVTFYACGGDGTLNEVACGAMGHSNARVAHIPCGTGNDFIRCFGIPKEEYFRLDRLIEGDEHLLDTINGTHMDSINICTTGLDARIAGEVHRIKRWPFMVGGMAYGAAVAYHIARGIGGGYSVTVDGRSYDGRYSMIVVANAGYYGGGYNPVPEARPDDGVLDVLLVKEVGRLGAAGLVRTYGRGEYARIPDVITKLTAVRVDIETERAVPFNYDGEIVRDRSATFALSEKKLRFVTPSPCR